MAKRGFSFAKTLGNFVGLGGRAVSALFGRRIGTRVASQAASRLMPVIGVKTPKGILRFWCASPISAKRAVGFMRHEPETREWIDSYVKAGDHVWDVGANVGAYTLYACLIDNVTATAFEPVAATFAILAKNVQANALGARVTPLCMALSDATGIVPIHLTSLEPGSAMHALERPENVRGEFESAGVCNIVALRGADAAEQFGLPAPHHVKIDVDGHEARVLQGLIPLMPRIRTICIEMIDAADQSGDNARIEKLLAEQGFVERPLMAGKQQRNRLFVNGSLRPD